MKRYEVAVREVHIRFYEIDAESHEDAENRAVMEGNETFFEFSHMSDSSHTVVKEMPNED